LYRFIELLGHKLGGFNWGITDVLQDTGIQTTNDEVVAIDQDLLRAGMSRCRFCGVWCDLIELGDLRELGPNEDVCEQLCPYCDQPGYASTAPLVKGMDHEPSAQVAGPLARARPERGPALYRFIDLLIEELDGSNLGITDVLHDIGIHATLDEVAAIDQDLLRAGMSRCRLCDVWGDVRELSPNEGVCECCTYYEPLVKGRNP